MQQYIAEIRSLFWSELCVVDLEAYRCYLLALENGLRIIFPSGIDGATELAGGECGGVDDDVRSQLAIVCRRDDGSCEVVDSASDFNHAVGAQDHVDGGVGTGGLVFGDRGIPADSASCSQCGSSGCRVDACVRSSWRRESDSKVDGGPVGVPLNVDTVSGKLPRGPNFERNQLNRANKKRRKQRERAANAESVDHPNGFWSSCSASVRQELIDSKARMHIAENEFKTKEARMKCSDADSPYALMQKAVRMADYAEKQAVKQDNGRIFGWAKTVATSSAESLARSVPSSVPSLLEVDAIAPSSQTSLDALELRVSEKDTEIQLLKTEQYKFKFEQDAKFNELEMTIAELRLAKGIVDRSGDLGRELGKEGTGSISRAPVKARKARKEFDVRSQPWPHVQIGRAEVYAEY